MRSPLHRRSLLTAAFLVVALAFSVRVSAGTIGISGGVLIFTSTDPGDSIAFGSTSGSDFILSVIGETIDIVTPGCTPGGGGVQCPLAGFTSAAIIEIAGDDVIEMSGVGSILPLFLSGGDGDDVIIGGAGNDILKGGAGDDVLIGGGGMNLLFGGPGDDVPIGGTIGDDAQTPPDPTLDLTVVPEPGTILLTVTGFGASTLARRRRRQRQDRHHNSPSI